MSKIVHRPWGKFIVLSQVKGKYKVKKLIVSPNAKLSLQKHEHRDEVWIVVEGKAFVTLDEKEIELEKSEHIRILRNTAHRLENRSQNEELIVIEIAYGEIINESDIIRITDDYGRI